MHASGPKLEARFGKADLKVPRANVRWEQGVEIAHGGPLKRCLHVIPGTPAAVIDALSPIALIRDI